MNTDQIDTWPHDEPLLEATAAVFHRCSHCGGILLSFEAADGSRFAVAHMGNSAQDVKDWMEGAMRDMPQEH